MYMRTTFINKLNIESNDKSKEISGIYQLSQKHFFEIFSTFTIYFIFFLLIIITKRLTTNANPNKIPMPKVNFEFL